MRGGGEGWGCPRPLSRLSRTEGWAVGIRHLIHSLSPPPPLGRREAPGRGGRDAGRPPFSDDPLSRGPPGLAIPPTAPSWKVHFLQCVQRGSLPGVRAAVGAGGGVAFCAAGWGWGWGWGNCIETSLPKQTAWGCESRASPAHARSGAGGRRSGRPGRAENPSAPCPCPGDAQGLPRPPSARSPLPTPLRGAAFRRGHHQAAARRSWRRRRGAGRRPAPGLAGVAGSPGPGGAGGRLPSGAAEMRTEAPALSRPCPPPGGRSGCGVPRAGSVAVFTFCLLAWVGLFL